MTWHGVEMPPDSAMTAMTVRGVHVLFVRLADQWHAVEDRCSHAGCAFSTDGELAGNTLICDCHGSEFDVATGAPQRMPASDPIRTFGVRWRADGLEVEL